MGTVAFEWVEIRLHSVVSGTKFTKFPTLNVGGIAVNHLVFLIVKILICSADTRNRSLKLSKTAPNFGRFCPPKF